MQVGADDEGHSTRSVLTRRLILRTPDAWDHAAIAALAANPRVAENLAAVPAALGGLGGAIFAIVDRATRLVIGTAAFGPTADRPASFEIASFVGEPHWGRGFATEATQAAIDRAFADERILRLWCANRVTNARARRVIEKCGFQFREGGMARSPTGKGAVPIERFVLDRRNWLSLKAWGSIHATGEFDAPRHTAA